MRCMRIKRIISLMVLLTIAASAPAIIPATQASNDNRTPDLPSPICDEVQAPAGNKVAFHVYAKGVQIYKWNGIKWDFVGPLATLYADASYSGEVGTHYAGPTWKSNGGSKVVAIRQQDCTPDSTAIPWLLLKAVTTTGPGIFSSVTYVQRVNTAGGLTPTTPGSMVDEVVEVPYTTEYYFYRAED